MSIATLIVAVRTTGAAQLTRLGAAFTALAARARAAATRIGGMFAALASRIRGVNVAARMMAGIVGSRFAALASRIRGVNVAVRMMAGIIGRAIMRVPVLGAVLRRLGAVARAVGRGIAAAFRGIGSVLMKAFSALGDLALDVLRGIGSGLMTVVKWFAILAPLIVPLIPPLISLTGLLPLIAPAALAAGAALATLAFGLRGVGGAISAGLSGDMAEFRKELKKLAPAAQQFAKAVVASAPAWRSIGKLTQQLLFVDLASHWKKFTAAMQPVLSKWLPEISLRFNSFIKGILDGFAQVAKSGRLDALFKDLDRIIGATLDTVENLGRAFFNLAEGAAPSLAEIAERIAAATKRFADWMREMKETGKIRGWVDQALVVLGQLRDIGREIGRVFSGIFKGAKDESKTFLENVRDTIKRLADWLHSEDGQEFISGIANFGAAIADVGNAINGWREDFNAFREWIRGVWEDITNAVTNAATTIRTVLAPIAGVAMAAFGWVQTVMGWLGTLRDTAANVAGSIRGAFGGVAGLASAFGWIGTAIGRLSALASHAWSIARSIQAAINSVVGRTVFLDIVTRRSEQGAIRSLGGRGGGKSVARHLGGSVMRGQPYVVGEKRAEVFVPGVSGRIQPRVPQGGGGEMTLNTGRGGLGDPLVEFFAKALRTGRLQLRDSQGRPVRVA